MGKIDFSKPIRQHNGLGARFIAKDSKGNLLIEAEFPDGNWSRACTWYPHEVNSCFENITAAKPKLEGFIEVYCDERRWGSGLIECQHENRPNQDMDDWEGQSYWLTIDLDKVPDEAIVKVAP